MIIDFVRPYSPPLPMRLYPFHQLRLPRLAAHGREAIDRVQNQDLWIHKLLPVFLLVPLHVAFGAGLLSSKLSIQRQCCSLS